MSISILFITFHAVHVTSIAILLQALYSHGGYVILDIRTNIEVDKYGMMPNDRTSAGSVCIPFFDAKRKFENGRSVEEKTENPFFLEDVIYEFPDKDENILVMDFDGNSGAVEALDLLFDEGYENIVGMQGGYKDWFRTWDNKMKRRNMGEYQEHSWGDGETSCGIHASGAGFANQDAQSADFWKSF